MPAKGTKKCPDCNGTGRREIGRSIAMNEAIRHGHPSTYECDRCCGTGKINKKAK